MQRRVRLGVAAGAAFMAAGLVVAALLAFTPVAGAATASVIDAQGDTVTDTIEDPIATPVADIVAMSADSQPDRITLAMRSAKASDPKVDGNWISDFTRVTWQLDTNGDGKRDYEIEYSLDQDTKQLTADLVHFGGGQPGDGCDPQPDYSPATGYSVTVDPKCLAGATAVSYRATFEYTTDAKDPSADVATDASPDKGWTGPVAVTLPAGVTPVTLSVPLSTQAGGPQSTPPTSSGPPQATTPSQSNGTTPTTTARAITPQQARPEARPSSGAGVVASPPSPGLASTGLSDRFVRLGGFAVGIVLIGIGLLFANRRPSLG